MQLNNLSKETIKATGSCCNDLEPLLSPELFKALGDTTRITLLAELARASGPRTVSEIAPCCTVDLSVVSRHLAILRSAGILEAEKRGRQVFYQIRFGALSRLLRSIADAIDACCPPSETACESGATSNNP